MDKLTQRQKAFAENFAISGVAEQSAIDAGYSERYARGNAHKLVAKSGIKEYLQTLNNAIVSDKIADMQEIKEFWTNTIRDNELDLKDRLKASELIAKTNGAFIDKVQHSGTISNEVVIEIGVAEDD